ncbi:MAG TPA: hypothetical protein PKI11_13005 [Candidatus Hydrogenedentes bacterium]|nr:hypothetical protein [Candidatus Hydrogenedentota bacterium]HNT86437.1 hypothetical protein [Candidatus Hydrogenedentota bacterium]
MRVFSQGVALGYHVMGLRPRMRELQRAARFGVKIVTPRAFLDQIGEKG